MRSASVTEDLEPRSDDGGSDPPSSAYELLALVEALGGLEHLLAAPRPTSCATAREELWAASEIVGWVLELLPEPSVREGDEPPAELVELQVALLRGQAALTAAAQRSAEPRQWDDVRMWLARTRSLLTVAAAALMP
jgi:hypothetical protein